MVGNKKQTHLIIIAVMLLAACVIVYRPSSPVSVTKPVTLREVLGPVPGYSQVSSVDVGAEIASFLELDDYTQASYVKDGHRISLYIGYYFSLDKLSAAHSPLVCFPGQGWKLEKIVEKQIELDGKTVNYAEMVGQLGEHKELIMFWYQVGKKTAPQVYQNKINGVFNQISGKKTEHAFVRVTVPFRNGEKDQAKKVGRSFIKSFYPIFSEYIDS